MWITFVKESLFFSLVGFTNHSSFCYTWFYGKTYQAEKGKAKKKTWVSLSDGDAWGNKSCKAKKSTKSKAAFTLSDMLKKKYRLPLRQPLSSPIAIHSLSIIIKYAPNTLPISRFGFVVSKRVDKRAVVRNRLKRSVSYCIEEQMTRIQSGYDFVFVLKPDALIPMSSLCAIIASSLSKHKLLLL